MDANQDPRRPASDAISYGDDSVKINMIYEHSRIDPGRLKELVLQLYVRGSSKPILQEHGLQAYPARFQQDLVIALLDARETTGRRSSPIHKCDFHRHVVGEECAAAAPIKSKPGRPRKSDQEKS